MSPYTFLKCRLRCIVILRRGLKINKCFQSTILVGREGATKKSTLSTLWKMLTILDNPIPNEC